MWCFFRLCHLAVLNSRFQWNDSDTKDQMHFVVQNFIQLQEFETTHKQVFQVLALSSHHFFD